MGAEIYNYTQQSKKKITAIFIVFLFCLVLFLIDILVGASGMSAAEVFAIITNVQGATAAQRTIVWNLRLPKAIMACFVGASLGLSGATMQTILGNPLASPYTLGISAGAGFGASFAMVMGLGALSSGITVPLCAFLCALLASLGIYVVSKRNDFSSSVMVLSGIGMVFFFQAGQSFMQYISSSETLSGIVFWTFGSLAKSNWGNTLCMIFVFLFVFILIYKDSWKLTALTMGEQRARVMGIPVSRLRMKLFLLISLLTATAVSFVGCIGFIGIIGPHIARILLGEDQRFYLPMSALTSAAILSAASIAAKVMIPGTIFPIGILTALIGVPIFFVLILKRGKSW